jgi:hypothetical protein
MEGHLHRRCLRPYGRRFWDDDFGAKIVLPRTSSLPGISASSFSTGPPGDRGALHCHWNANNLNKFRFSCAAFYQGLESKVGLARQPSGGVEDKPQYRQLWHRRNPCARCFSRSPSPRQPPLTQYPFPPRSLVRGGQTSPHKLRLVASHSTYPALSSSPYAHSIVIGLLQ